MDDYRESHKSIDKPGEYDQKFWTPGTPEYLFWQIEQQILEDAFDSRSSVPKMSLDFACGTGRVLSWVAPKVEKCIGVDVSTAMLSVARERCPSAEIIEADITRNSAVAAGPFDFVTSFRFFLNAQRELQHEALDAIRQRIAEDGTLVVNFHLNPFSPTGVYHAIGSRLVGSPRPVASTRKARRLIEAHGFEVTKVRGYAYLFYRRVTLRFPGLATRAENALARWNLVPWLASHFVVIARPC
ncbi:MAG: class I SAM-dependent methyltransferase [Planctomycetales bacterium]|nr:class I SAM-dependent methyltransferase [Planctomycetales bacterium]